MKEKIIAKINDTIAFQVKCIKENWEEFIETNQERLKAMVEIAEIACDCKFEITEEGLKEI